MLRKYTHSGRNTTVIGLVAALAPEGRRNPYRGVAPRDGGLPRGRSTQPLRPGPLKALGTSPARVRSRGELRDRLPPRPTTCERSAARRHHERLDGADGPTRCQRPLGWQIPMTWTG